jgi:hypothetical protein
MAGSKGLPWARIQQQPRSPFSIDIYVDPSRTSLTGPADAPTKSRPHIGRGTDIKGPVTASRMQQNQGASISSILLTVGPTRLGRRVNSTGNRLNSLNFFVIGMFPASIAKLRRFEPVLMFFPVFGRRIVPVFAVVAL